MAQLTLVRIDDRLIHGQVVTAWLKSYDSDIIIVTDDGVAKDKFAQRVLKAAAPQGVAGGALSVADTLRFFKAPKYASKRVMIIVKGPEAVEGLVDGGVPIKRVILGGMGKKEGRESLNRNVSASPDEIACLKRLVEKGVAVEYALVPDDAPVPLSKIVS